MSDYPAVIPMIAYQDGPKAMDWLAAAFGVKERARMTTPEGRLSHREMEAGGGGILLATSSPDHEGPHQHREGCEPGREWSPGPHTRARAHAHAADSGAH